MRRVVLLITVFSVVYGPVAESTCFDRVISIFNREIHLTDIERENLFNGLDKWQIGSAPALTRQPLSHAAVLYDQMPAELKEIIHNIPNDHRKSQKYIASVRREIGPNHFDHPLISIMTIISDGYLFKENRFEKMKRELEVLSVGEKRDISLSLDRQITLNQANDLYNTSLYLKFVRDGDAYLIGNNRYQFKKERGVYFLLVPKYQMKRPAWNPFEKIKLRSIIENNTPAPDTYRVDIGLDGNFYILDGNHRFHLKEERDKIWVEVGREVKSTLLSRYQLLVGGPSLSDERKLKLLEGDYSDFLEKAGLLIEQGAQPVFD